MPTYHYRCPNGHDFDRFERKISNKSKTKCPECGKMAERQVSGGLGFHLKGSGFYATDYKPSADKSDKADKTDKADKAGKADKANTTDKQDASAKSDAKPKKKDAE